MMKYKIFQFIVANNRGTAILIVLALIAILVAVGIMSVDRSTTDIELSFNQLHEDKAFYIAEAGIQRALAELKNDQNWRDGFYRQVLNGGYYNITVIDSVTDSILVDTVILRSQGYLNKAVSNIEVWTAPEFYSPFVYAAYGDDSVIISNHVCTDSYNSDSGTYAATQLNEQGDIGSNGGIELTNNSTVNGGAQTSDTGNLAIVHPATVTGDTTSTAPVIDNSAVSEDDFDWAESVNNAPAGFSGSYSYNPGIGNLSLGRSDTLILSSGVYYFNNISLNNRSNIRLAPGAKVEIYMTGDFTINQLSKVNEDGNPSDFIVYSKGSSFTMGNNTTFVGAFWSETADVVLKQHVELYGSVSANSVQISNYSCIHFDRDLLNYSSRKMKQIKVVAWRQE